MSVVNGARMFAQRRAHAKSVERFNQETERLATHLEARKCCATLETGHHLDHPTTCSATIAHLAYTTDINVFTETHGHTPPHTHTRTHTHTCYATLVRTTPAHS